MCFVNYLWSFEVNQITKKNSKYVFYYPTLSYKHAL